MNEKVVKQPSRFDYLVQYNMRIVSFDTIIDISKIGFQGCQCWICHRSGTVR